MAINIGDTLTRLKRPLLYVMGIFYIGAGVIHFVVPKVYARIVPPQFPRPVALVYLSGVAEVILGIGMMIRRTRRRSAWGLIALLIAVFPANVYMATSDMATDMATDWTRRIARVTVWARLPLQAVLILWAWWYVCSTPEDAK